MGVPLETVLDSVKQWASGFGDPEPANERVTAQRKAQSDEAAMVAQNERALAELRRMMPGLGV